MGSFSWTCCCGCGREITPSYNGRHEYDCDRCGTKVLEGKEIVVLMPDGKHIEGHYGDYGNIEQDGEIVLEMYAWVAKANVTGFNPHEDGSSEFWKTTRDFRMEEDGEEKARLAGIYGDSRQRHKETEEVLTNEEFREMEGWGTREFWDTTAKEYEKIDAPYKYPIKMMWKYCSSKTWGNSPAEYDEYEPTEDAPNQGFGNIHELECCGLMVCSECDESCCDKNW